MRLSTILFTLVVFIMAFSMPAHSTHWAWDGIPVCDYISTKGNQRMASDGAGGAFVVWEDSRTGSRDIFIQRIGPDGAPYWAVDGIRATTSTRIDGVPRVISDGLGGAIVAWGGDAILAQRVDSGGNLLWTDEGVLVSSKDTYQRVPRLASDGKGGAIIAWEDYRSGNYDIYARRVRADGALLWTAHGVPVCTQGSHQRFPIVAADDCGGAIIVWDDERPATRSDIYAQRVDSMGTMLWTADGIAVASDGLGEDQHDVIPDMAGGAIVCWHLGDGSAESRDIFAQRVDGSGTLLWSGYGVPVCTESMGQERPRIAPDGSGGAIIAWYDSRKGDYDIYAQRLTSGGLFMWTAGGVPVCTENHSQTIVEIAPSGTGGAALVWTDRRFYPDRLECVFGEIIDGGGNCLWGSSGFPVCIQEDLQQWPRVVTDGCGGGIFLWIDGRNNRSDFYAQRLNLDFEPVTGEDPQPVQPAILLQNYPNPFNPVTTIIFSVGADGPVSLRIYDPAGRRVATLVDGIMPAGSHAARWEGRGEDGSRVNSGVYFYRLIAGDFDQTRKMVLLR